MQPDQGVTVTTSLNNAMKSAGKIPATPALKASIGASTRIVQGKSQPATNILQNPVLPMTIMQTQSQNGNVIKVIVPPGTMVNGANGQQV